MQKCISVKNSDLEINPFGVVNLVKWFYGIQEITFRYGNICWHAIWSGFFSQNCKVVLDYVEMVIKDEEWHAIYQKVLKHSM